MFLNQTFFNKLMKEAYKYGLHVWNYDGKRIHIGDSYWSATIAREYIPKETMGNLIRLIGELPKPNTGFTATKDGQQMEFTPRTLYAEDSPVSATIKITDMILVAQSGLMQRIVQNTDTGELYLIRNIFTDLVDNSLIIDTKGEYAAGDPVLTETYNTIRWANNVCILNVLPIEDLNNQQIMARLKGIDLTKGGETNGREQN